MIGVGVRFIPLGGVDVSARLLRLVGVPRGLLGFAVIVALAASLAGPALAQAQVVDPCLLGSWTYDGLVINSLNAEPMLPPNTVELTFPSATSGAAVLRVDLWSELRFRHFVGSADESYSVTAASTPSLPAGALDWGQPAAPIPVLPIYAGLNEIPGELAPGGYSCTAAELTIAVPVAFVGPLTFTRVGDGPAQSTVTVAKQGTGMNQGTVAGTVEGLTSPLIDCGPMCTGGFWGTGKKVTLTETPGASTFTGWGGDCAPYVADPTCSSGNTTTSATATFGNSLTVRLDGIGTGLGAVSSPQGSLSPIGEQAISCPGLCESSFAEPMILSAGATSPSVFMGWRGGGCPETPLDRPVPDSPECTVKMSGPASVTATFGYTLYVTKDGSGFGAVTSSPLGLDFGNCSDLNASCSAPFAEAATLTAVADSGSKFKRWGRDCAGSSTDECRVSVWPSYVTATFTKDIEAPDIKFHKLTVKKEGVGDGTVQGAWRGAFGLRVIDCGAICSAEFDETASPTLTAVAATGSTFTGWGGGSCSGTSPCQVAMDKEQSVTASFSSAPVKLALVQQLAQMITRFAQTPVGANLVGLLKHGAATVFNALVPGSAVFGWYDMPPGAKLARAGKAKPILVAIGRHTFARAGTAAIAIKFTPAGKALLRHVKRLRVTAKATFTPFGKTPITARKTFVLRR